MSEDTANKAPKEPKAAKKEAKGDKKPKRKSGVYFLKNCKHDGVFYKAGDPCSLQGAKLKGLLENGIVEEV